MAYPWLRRVADAGYEDIVMEAMHSNPFNAGDSRSRRDKFDNKLRLALGRGLAATYADVLREPIPERLQQWLRRLESRERQEDGPN
jgi:hypothetical protein